MAEEIDFKKTGVKGPQTFATFGCDVFKEDPATPDRLEPDVHFERVFSGVEIEMPDGKEVEFWTIDDPLSGSGPIFPSPIIRVREGQVVHVRFEPSKSTHTIHLHGIEPTPFNDGVGHTSFEISDFYTYQFQPAHAGTYFYHCHKNTVLHFEMGMYGLLVVDPPSGPGMLYEPHPADRDPIDVRYDVEAFWVADDIDPRWRKIDHEAGLCGEDAGLNIFEPTYFLISGVPHPETREDPRAVVKVKRGETALIRFLNASYSVVSLTIDGLDATVAEVDGRPLRHNPLLGSFSKPFVLEAGEELRSTAAQRYALFVRPEHPGRYRVRMEFLDWIRGEAQDRFGGDGVAETYIEVIDHDETDPGNTNNPPPEDPPVEPDPVGETPTPPEPEPPHQHPQYRTHDERLRDRLERLNQFEQRIGRSRRPL